MAEDNIQIEILPDGRIKSITDPISSANHSSASEFFRLMAQLAGGETTKQKRADRHQHVHTHQHEQNKAGH